MCAPVPTCLHCAPKILHKSVMGTACHHPESCILSAHQGSVGRAKPWDRSFCEAVSFRGTQSTAVSLVPWHCCDCTKPELF